MHAATQDWHKTASHQLNDASAQLFIDHEGRTNSVTVALSKPAIIGRNADKCSYVINNNLISGIHCKIYAVRSPSGGIIVSCQDVSLNGISLNGNPIKKTSIILTNGDIIDLPCSIRITCVLHRRDAYDNVSLFDPTPPTHPAQKTRAIGNYVVTSQCLGTGSFATVHLAMDHKEHRQVACKSIRTKRESDIGQVMKEVKILMTLKHPNINEIYATEQNKKFIHIFLQLCTGGDLFTYITHATGLGSRICEPEAKYIMYQLLLGLKYLHDRSIAHRDLKPENILLHCPGLYPRILLADFGLARPNSYQETFNVCGTVSYLPPEGVLALDNKHLAYIGLPADCWSAGVILYIMLAGSHPFDHDTRPSSYWESNSADSAGFNYSQCGIQLKARIVGGNIEYFDSPWRDLSTARNLVEMLLIRDPTGRATVYSSLKCDWILDDIDALKTIYHERVHSGTV